MIIVTHVIRRVLYVTVILGGSSSYTRDPEELAGGAPSRPVFLNLHHGGAVFCIEGSSRIDCIQAASCGRPSLRSPKPRCAATSSATARVKYAIVGGPASADRQHVPQIHPPYAWRELFCAPKLWANVRPAVEPSRVPTRRCLRTCCAPRIPAADNPSQIDVGRRENEVYHLSCRDKRRMIWLSSMPTPASS